MNDQELVNWFFSEKVFSWMLFSWMRGDIRGAIDAHRIVSPRGLSVYAEMLGGL